MSPSLKCAPHEGNIRFTFGVHPNQDVVDDGLAPYYAMDSLIKEWGDRWENPDFKIEEVKQFRFYFVSKNTPTYYGNRADKDSRIKGGTITIRPRWPDLTSDGKPVSVPDYGAPYIDVQVQASNIPHQDYLKLVKRVISAYGITSRYFDQPHPDSHINDLAYYVRLLRSESGPLYAPDGPIARTHTLIQGDRSGYRKHVEDNVSTRSDRLVQGLQHPVGATNIANN